MATSAFSVALKASDANDSDDKMTGRMIFVKFITISMLGLTPIPVHH